MAKKMLIDATHPEETRVVVADGSRVEDFDYESINKRQLAGNIYLAKVIRVEPSLQAAFVDYGGNRHGFLAFSEIHPDYYQIPAADREALLAAEAEEDQDEDSEEESRPAKAKTRAKTRSGAKRRSRGGKTAKAATDDGAAASEATEAPGASEPDAAEAQAAPEAQAAGHADAQPAPEAGDDPDAAKPAHAPSAESSDAADNENDADAPQQRPMAESAGADEVETVSEPFDGAETTTEARAEDAPGDGGSKPRKRRRSRKKTTEADAPATEADSEDDLAETAPESVAAEAVEDEVRPRRARPRSYKIQEVIKPRQIVLVQVVKEERGNKGAALTTYLSLAGRYCVLMPNTARGGGISRKITNAADRKKLKEIAGELDVPKGMGLIVRTAGAQRTRTEIKRDYEFLLRQWEQVRELTLKSVAPTLIYEEGSLIKRSIRDLYSKEIDEVLVGGEEGYREAKDYMRMLMPSHAKNVQPYRDTIPLFSRYQVENYLAAMFNPTVQLKSGGYIVIGITEALVAIDVNSGRSTREGSIEETALKTNLEAADEVARQLRLRDLAGLIVIDFIDMDERRNNAAVERRLKERLKSDRARIQVGRISAFGLLEMSRQRLRPGMLEASTAPCPHCHGTGIIRSEESLALSILRDVEDEGVRGRFEEVRVVAPVGIANFIMNRKRDHVAAIETRYGLRVLVEGDAALISPDYRIEKVKATTTPEAQRPAPAVRAESAYDAAEDAPEEPTRPEPKKAEQPGAERESEDEKSRNRRRRGKRGGRKRRRSDEDGPNGDPLPVLDSGDDEAGPMSVSDGPFGAEIGGAARDAEDDRPDEDQGEAPTPPVEPVAAQAQTPTQDDAPPAAADAEAATPEDAAKTPEAAEPPAGETAAQAEIEAGTDSEPVGVAAEFAPKTLEEQEDPNRPKRRGWWNIGRS
jgi:ribonuclease E